MDTTALWIAIVLLAVVAIIALFRPRRSYQVELVNIHRKRNHLKPLQAYYPLDRFAKDHSRYMARRRDCSHDRFGIRSAKVMKVTRSDLVGENCYMYPSESYCSEIDVRLVEGWMESPEHRANILNPKYSKIGIGVVVKEKCVYATQIFCS